MAERKRETAILRLVRRLKRPRGIWLKMAAVAVLGLCFVFFWSFFSSSASSITVQRESFDDITEPVSSNTKTAQGIQGSSKVGEKGKVGSGPKHINEKKVNGSISVSAPVHKHETRKKKEHVVSHPHKKREVVKPVVEEVEGKEDKENQEQEESESDDSESRKEAGEEGVEEGTGEGDGNSNVEGDGNGDGDGDGDGDDSNAAVDQEAEEKIEEVSERRKQRKIKGPVFDPKASYRWRLCSTRSKHNYIPCVDNDGIMGRLQVYRYRERTCPRKPVMCLVPLPHDGYDSPVTWPECKSKVLYKNIAHPKLATYIKQHNWLTETGEYLTFPPNQTMFKDSVLQYLEFIEEMVPDIEWGKNVRVVLDIGCSDSSFVAALLGKDVLTLSLGLKDDLVDLAQVSLERGFPAVVSHLANRRLPFPSGVFDAIHCAACGIHWHSHGVKLLLEMNRILRPNGYFILSSTHEKIEDDEAMTSLTASICWNILAHKTDETSEMGVRIYQKPESNDIYELRRKKNPPICKENENPDAAWYVPMKTCLHEIPSAIEQHGTEWPEEWPKRLETYPEWLNQKEKAIADTDRWKAFVNQSYLTGLGIDWSRIRNVMDMTAIYGGFAAALVKQNVWVMNVVPVHAPDTLPFIYERGLIGMYHDWCESFGTYPRSYDLLHADHLFSRLKNRCKQPASIVVEMDRLTRPGGWVIVRDKVEILEPLEGILRSLHWEIRMTYAQEKEGMLCAQKTLWRP
ncbi:PREDICTED: probable methyltransferase PMT28 [Tarenaya hassleriana]|uniref:probable methyltransferase PMT28 n=1 Tax=Tarenaya hassleriana TaxID=28532 RepID=UPI00053C9ABA|nr:PREDICTED: probable methyltransferase PMT28 [Tarenaya hassleriana]